MPEILAILPADRNTFVRWNTAPITLCLSHLPCRMCSMTARALEWVCTECGWQGEPTQDTNGSLRCAGGHSDPDLLLLNSFLGQSYLFSLALRALGREIATALRIDVFADWLNRKLEKRVKS